MKKFIIERELTGAGKLTAEELQAISMTSVSVIAVMDKPYKWVESFVTDNKVYCIHEADSEEEIREHSKCGNLPITSIQEIRAVIDPSTATEDHIIQPHDSKVKSTAH